MINDKATVDNVKIVFFDVLAKQISSLIKLKEQLSTATGDKFDELSNEYESQFNLLKDTLSNVESLMSNVEKFDSGGKSSSIKVPVSEAPVIPSSTMDESTVSSVVPGEVIEDDDFDEPSPENKFITDGSSVDTSEEVEVSPLIPVSPSFEKATDDLIKNYNLSLEDIPSDDDKPKEDEKEEPKPVPLVPENILVEAQKEDDASGDEKVTEAEAEDTETDEEEKPTLVNLQEDTKEEVSENKEPEKVVLDKCIKISDKQTKAIVVNVQQLEKLRTSREEETNKLDFGVTLTSSDTNTSIGTDEIEQLLQQANDLYKQGRAIEAEKIYQRIRELNKK